MVVVLGILAATVSLSVVLWGIPKQIRLNYQRKSCEGFEPSMVYSTLAIYLLWGAYGLAKPDLFMAISCIPGFFVTSILLWQLHHYKKTRRCEMKALSKVWPLFDLRIFGPRIELRLPTEDELAQLGLLAAEFGVSDPSQITFSTPWDKKPSPDLERGVLQHFWSKRASWGDAGKFCLSLGLFLNGKPIGMQDAWASDYPITRTAETGSWVSRKYQGKGYGTEARGAMLHFFFQHLGAVEMYSGAFVENKASMKVSRRWGYEDNGLRLEKVEGYSECQYMQGLRLTKKMWEKNMEKMKETKKDVPEYSVVGLEPCLHMFGLKPN